MVTSSEQVLIAQAAMTATEGRMNTGRIDRRTLTAGLIGIMGLGTGAHAGAQPHLPQDKPPRTWMRHSDPAGTCRVPGGVMLTATPGNPRVVLDTINFTLPHQGNDLSPTVANMLREGSLVYAAGFVGRSGPQGAIFAVDNDSGEVAWQSATFDGVDLLALDEKHVIARAFDAGTTTYPIIALDRATGSREAWRIDDLRIIGPPVVIDGLLLLAAGSVTAAHNLATGEHRWTVERPVVNGFAPRALAATADVVIACEPLGDSQVIAWRLDTGEELWRMDTGGFLILTPPMIVGDRIFVAAERELIEIDGASGRPVAYIEHGVDMASTGGHLAYAANRIMVRSTSGIASFSAIDLEPEWHWQPETWLPDYADILCTDDHAIVRVNAELDYWQGAVFDVVDLHTGTVVATYPSRDDLAGIERGYLAASVGDNQLAFATEAGIVLYGAVAGR